MKSTLLLAIFHLPLALFCQETIIEPWTSECGASTNTFFNTTPSFNLRYISPYFKWSSENSEDYEEEVAKTKQHKDFRLMLEVIYGPPIKVLATALKVQYCLVKQKKASVEVYMGPKIFFIPGPDFINVPRLKGGKDTWYYNIGIICQAHLNGVSPFVDIGTDGIFTVGAELNLHSIYRNPKKRYKLRKYESQASV